MKTVPMEAAENPATQTEAERAAFLENAGDKVFGSNYASFAARNEVLQMAAKLAIQAKDARRYGDQAFYAKAASALFGVLS